MSKLEQIKKVVKKYRDSQEEETSVIKSGKWNNLTRDFYALQRADIEKELLELGLEFRCTDYGEEYCLDLCGLEAVLKAIEE
jgi:hypothetical protein